MSEPIRIVVGGQAEPYRERASVRAGHVWSYRPDHLQRYQAHLKFAVDQVMDGRPPLEGPVSVAISVYLPIPASLSKRKQALAETNELKATKRPDLTQYIKAAEDALTNRAIKDDAQVVIMAAEKRYSDRPRIEIEVRELRNG